MSCKESFTSPIFNEGRNINIGGGMCVCVRVCVFVYEFEYERYFNSSIDCRGGVLTPGVAFKNTSLVERLVKSGIEFSTFPVERDHSI